MSLIKDILGLLKSSRQGMTAYEIFKSIPDYPSTKRDFHVNLSAMVTRNTVRTDGTRPCIGCEREHVVYRITDHGRIHSDSELYQTSRVKKKELV